MGGERGTSVEDRKFKILLARHKRDKALKTIIILLCVLVVIYTGFLVGLIYLIWGVMQNEMQK